jgi:hypothetical protein
MPLQLPGDLMSAEPPEVTGERLFAAQRYEEALELLAQAAAAAEVGDA